MIPRRFFWLLDALVLGLAFLAAYVLTPALHWIARPAGLLQFPWLYSLFSPAPLGGQMPPLQDLAWMYFIMLAAVLLVLMAFSDYGRLLSQSRTRIIAACLLAALWGTGLVTLVIFALKSTEWSRLFVVSFMVLSALGLAGYRLLLRSYFLIRQHAGLYARNVLLVGQRQAIDWMARYFAAAHSANNHHVLGQLCVNGDEIVAGTEVPCLGRVDELGDLLIHHPIHEVIAVQPLSSGEWMDGVIRACDYMGVILRIVPEALLREQQQLRTLYPFATLNLPAVVLAPPHWDSDSLFVKRLMDIALSALLLFLLSPLFLAVAIAIKLTTPNLPVLYRWRAVGQNGVEFSGYKFTTMVADAEARKSDLQAQNEMSGPVFKIKNDPRVTPLGRFLRKYSLNELPQLWNVLKGEMSLVGPRPALRNELAGYDYWHKRKLSIKPGMTCLWQVRGRNKISNFDEWVRMDLEYIDNWSLWLDCRILIRTVWVVLAGTGS